MISRVARWALWLSAGLVWAVPRPAHAAGHTCELSADGAFAIDGMVDDWHGYEGFRIGDDGARVTLRCAYDSKKLYLELAVDDDKLIRTRQAVATAEDSVTISLAADSEATPVSWRMFPGAPTARPKRVGLPRWAEVEDSLSPTGFTLELALPLARLHGYGASTPVLLADVVYHDTDHATAGKIEREVGFHGRLHFSSHLPAYRGFLAATHLKPKDLTLDVLADVDGNPGTERVVWGGGFIGVLSDGFAFLALPVTAPADVAAVRVVDVAGTSKRHILGDYWQKGGGGKREVVSLWQLGAGGTLETVLAFETAQVLGDRQIHDRWQLVPARTLHHKGKVRGQALVIEVGDVVGWDAQSYAEVTPSADLHPVLTPWGPQQSAVWWFDGDVATGGEPLPR